MKKLIFIFITIMVLSGSLFAQNPNKISPQRATDELINFTYDNVKQVLRVWVVGDSSSSVVTITKTALDSAMATSALQDSIKNRIIETMAYLGSLVTNSSTSANQTTQITRSDSILTEVDRLLTELSKKPDNNNADSLLNIGNILTELTKKPNNNNADSLLNIGNILTELAKKPNNNNADSLLNIGNILTELAKLAPKLDSLYNKDVKYLASRIDTTSDGLDSLDISALVGSRYTYIITAGDSIEYSFDRTFATGKTFALLVGSTPESYTSGILNKTLFPYLYYRRYVISGGTGTPLVRIWVEGY